MKFQREVELPIFYEDIEVGKRRVDFLVDYGNDLATVFIKKIEKFLLSGLIVQPILPRA